MSRSVHYTQNGLIVLSAARVSLFCTVTQLISASYQPHKTHFLFNKKKVILTKKIQIYKYMLCAFCFYVCSACLKDRKPSLTTYTAFKRNSTIRNVSSSNEKPLQYQNTTMALFLFTSINTTLNARGQANVIVHNLNWKILHVNTRGHNDRPNQDI